MRDTEGEKARAFAREIAGEESGLSLREDLADFCRDTTDLFILWLEETGSDAMLHFAEEYREEFSDWLCRTRYDGDDPWEGTV